MDGPRHALATVRSLAATDDFVVGHGRALAMFDDVASARSAIRAAIAGLSALAFAHTVEMPSGPFDVYGVEREDGGWYLKLALLQVQGRRLFVVSFHPLEFPLATSGGWVHP